MNDFPLVLGYVFGTVGWLAGLGVFNDLFRQMLGKPVPVVEEEAERPAAWPSTSGTRWTTRSSASSTCSA